MTEAELAAIEALFKLEKATDELRQRLLEMTIEKMHQGNRSFDEAFLLACEQFRVPIELLAPHIAEIEQARR